MKREIKEKKQSLTAAPEKKASSAETLTKKAQPDKAKGKSTTEIKLKKGDSKNSALKSKPEQISATAAKFVKPTKKPSAVTIKAEATAKKNSVKDSGKISAKTKVPVAEEKSVKPKTRKKSVAAVENKNLKADKKTAAKIQPAKDKTAETKKKPETRNIKAPLSFQKSKVQFETAKLKAEKKANVVAKNATAKTKNTVSIQKIKPQLKGDKAKTAAVKTEKPAKRKAENISVQKIQPKPILKAAAKEVKLSKQKAAPEKLIEKPIEAKVESAEIAPKKKIVNKKAKPIGSAVFRGKKEKYDFQVFALDEKFDHIKAVYIISKRKTDRKKRGHHKLVCIGQTDSVIDGIKEHKKDKCIRRNDANVICLLKEEDEKNRLRIAADLREAHAIACERQ